MTNPLSAPLTLDGFRAGVLFCVAGALVGIGVAAAVGDGDHLLLGVLGFVLGIALQQVVCWGYVGFATLRGLFRWAARR